MSKKFGRSIFILCIDCQQERKSEKIVNFYPRLVWKSNGEYVAIDNSSSCCRTVTLRRFFVVDRPESYSATHSKNCIYFAEIVAHGFNFISPYFHFVRYNQTSLSILFSLSFFFFNMISLEFSLFCKNTILDQAVIKTEIKTLEIDSAN